MCYVVCCSSSVKHNWDTMRDAVNNYIGSLNWGYRVALRDKNVNYVNAYAEFIEPHKIKVQQNTFCSEDFYELFICKHVSINNCLIGNKQTREGDILYFCKVCVGNRREAPLSWHPRRQGVLHNQVCALFSFDECFFAANV